MNTKKRLIEFVLHGHPDKFKSVLKEEITNRATDLIFNLSLAERQNILNSMGITEDCLDKQQPIKEESVKFYPEKSYRLKDGNIGILDVEEQNNISKLYESLNNGNRERLVKLLSESQESFNKIVKLAKIESKRMNNEQ